MNSNPSKRISTSKIFASSLLLSVSPLGFSQEEPAEVDNEDRILAPVTVTAQKREQNLQDVGISVSAYTGAQLEALGLNNTTEITEQIPALQLNAWSPKLTIFNLRGVSQNNFTDNLEAPVAVYMDNAYMGSINGISGQLFDTERVEILRGPQGTLFGRNATGGLIHYISRGADSEETNGYALATVGDLGRTEVEGAVGGSLSETARLRVAGRYAKADGYIKSTDTVTPRNAILKASGQDLGGENGWAIRANLQADFNDQLSGSFWIKFSDDSDVPTGGYVFANCTYDTAGFCNVDRAGLGNGSNGVFNGINEKPATPYQNFAEQEGFWNREVSIYQAELNYSMANNTNLTSITNITNLKQDYLEDGDALPILVINFGNAIDFSQMSQEIRLSGSDDKMNWQTGIYYLSMELDGSVTTVGAPVAGEATRLNLSPTGAKVEQSYVIESKNTSLFGQIEYEISETMTLIGGLRLSQDDKSIDYSSKLFAKTTGNTPVDREVPLGSDEKFVETIPGVNEIGYSDWAGRLGMDIEVNERTLVFLSYNRGIKGGNWTLSSDVSAQTFRHDEEVLNSFEVGTKTTSADGSLRFNGTLFLYDYKDYQAFALTGGTPQVTNSDATASGGELELFWNPTSQFNMILGATLQNSKVDEVAGPAQQPGGVFVDNPPATTPNGYCTLNATRDGYRCDYPEDTVKDVELPNAPAFSFNYLFRYELDAWDGNLALQADGVYYDKQYLEVTNGRSSLQDAYNLTNISATWANDEGYEVQLYIRNVLDEEYAVYSLNLGILGTTQYYGPPTTYGLSLRKRW